MSIEGADDAIYGLKFSVNQFAAEVMIEVDQLLVDETPKDEGTASANWIPTINKPATSRRGKGKRRIEAATRFDKVNEKPVKLYIRNNLKYIRRLNDGWSKQQPEPGWVQNMVRLAAKRVSRRYA